MAHLLRRCASLRLLAFSRRTLDQRRIDELYSKGLLNRPSLSWAQLVSLRSRYSTKNVADSAQESAEETQKSSEKGLRLSDSCVKVWKLSFFVEWSMMLALAIKKHLKICAKEILLGRHTGYLLVIEILLVFIVSLLNLLFLSGY